MHILEEHSLLFHIGNLSTGVRQSAWLRMNLWANIHAGIFVQSSSLSRIRFQSILLDILMNRFACL